MSGSSGRSCFSRLAAPTILAAGVACATLLFWMTDLDMRAARPFYRPEAGGNPWPGGDLPLWRFLHQAAPWLTAAFGFTGLWLLCGPSRRHRTTGDRPAARRLDGMLLVLSLALGPGLLVNAVFKDGWGRPRPRQVASLGGQLPYVPPLQPGPYGSSFPCGHSSVGFVYGAFYYVLRERRPVAARLCLLGSGALGLALGVGRMAAGAHYLSDVLWAGVITYGSMHLVRRGIEGALELSQHPASRAVLDLSALPRPARLLGGAGLGGLLVFCILLATPFEESLSRLYALPAPEAAARSLEFEIEEGDARLILTRAETHSLVSTLRFKGFAVPGGFLRETLLPLDAARHTLRYELRPRGLFADLEGEVTLRVPATAVRALSVSVRRGLLTIESEVPPESLPVIHLRSPRQAVRFGSGVPRDRVRLLGP